MLAGAARSRHQRCGLLAGGKRPIPREQSGRHALPVDAAVHAADYVVYINRWLRVRVCLNVACSVVLESTLAT